MADSTTTLGFVQPEVGSSSDTWGGKLNADLTLADTLLQRLVGTTTTHLLSFNVTGVSTSTTRSVTWIDENITVVGATNTQTLTNKTLTDANVNTQSAGSNTTKAASTAFVGWQKIATSAPAAATTIDFTGISSSINHLMLFFEIQVGTDAVNCFMQTYGADGLLDTGSSDYFSMVTTMSSANSSVSSVNSSAASITLASSVDNSDFGLSGEIKGFNIQAATRTKFNYQTQYLDSGGSVVAGIFGAGDRQEADRITGIRIATTAGVFTGKATLFGSV